MADFHQPKTVTTIHRLAGDRGAAMEQSLQSWGRSRPVGLVLPALYTEFQHPAMARIARELASAKFIRRIVVALGQANEAQYRHARRFFDGFDIPVTFLQVDHPRVGAYLAQLGRAGFPVGQAGKGRTCWLSTGYLLAHGDCDVIALHDCDIRNYSRDLLARLCAPLAHPELEFAFAKGYYARVGSSSDSGDGRMFGRVTRLFVTPLVRALRSVGVESSFLEFVADLRYPLSGEMAFCADLARSMPTPADWGLEIGTLAEVHRRVPLARVCQVEVADVYEHKHKTLSADSATEGLHRMTLEVGAALFRAVASAVDQTPGWSVEQLRTRYCEIATQMVARYRADARLNGLAYDVEAEQQAVSVFAGAIPHAFAAARQPAAASLAPWTQIETAFPKALDRLRDVVDEVDTLRPRTTRVAVRARVARLLGRKDRELWAPAALPAEDFA